MLNRLKKQRKKGFTLVELIVVLVILAILIALLVPALTGYIDSAREKQAYSELNLIAKASKSAYAGVYGAGLADNAYAITYYPNRTSSESVDRAFKDDFESYISPDVDTSKILSLGLTLSSGKITDLNIYYKIDSKIYHYQESDGKVTLGRYTGPNYWN